MPCSSLEDTRCYPQAVNGTADCRQASSSMHVPLLVMSSMLGWPHWHSYCPVLPPCSAMLYCHVDRRLYCRLYHRLYRRLYRRRDWSYNCEATQETVALTSLASAFLLLTLAVYFCMLVFAQRQLARRPYVAYKVANIGMRVQVTCLNVVRPH